MRTPSQIEASRRNGAKSRGPITPEGKRVSSQNARRHSAIAQSVSLELEDRSQFTLILDTLIAEHQPLGFTEHALVENMAVARWKQFRILCAEKVAIDLQARIDLPYAPDYHHAGAATMAISLRNLTTANRYLTELNLESSRLDRQFQRAILTLLKLQDRRRDHPPSAPQPFEAPETADFQPDEKEDTQLETEATDPSAVPATDPEAITTLLCLPPAKKCSQRTHHPLETNDLPGFLHREPDPRPFARAAGNTE